MSPYTAWPAAVCLLAVLSLTATPLFLSADQPPTDSGSRKASLDGLRGLAAFAVFLQHAAIAPGYAATGVWAAPVSRLYDPAGPVGVSAFFMITGYLFWSILLRESGRPRWLALYVGRLFRIGPLFLVAVSVMMVMVAARSGFALRESSTVVIGEAARWLSLGVLRGGMLDGDADATLLLAGVTWTLQLEWAFYAALPLLALGARSRRGALLFSFTVLLVGLVWWSHRGPYGLSEHDAAFMCLFAIGMVTASLEAAGSLPRLPDPIGSTAVLGLVTAAFVSAGVYGSVFVALLGLAFLLVCSGTTVFGLLRCRAARRLGSISYGVYLLQGPVLALAYTITAVRVGAFVHGWAYWLVTLGCAVILLAIATVVHAAVELPGIRLGQMAVRRFVGARTRSTSTPASMAGAEPL